MAAVSPAGPPPTIRQSSGSRSSGLQRRASAIVPCGVGRAGLSPKSTRGRGTSCRKSMVAARSCARRCRVRPWPRRRRRPAPPPATARAARSRASTRHFRALTWPSSMCRAWSRASSRRPPRPCRTRRACRTSTRGGRSTPDSLFRIASMSQGVHRARHPEAARRGPAVARRARPKPMSRSCAAGAIRPAIRPRIRVRDLLSHVGGFVTDDPWGDRQQVLPEAEFTRDAARGRALHPRARQGRSNIPISAMPCSAGSSPTSRAGPIKDYIEQEIMRPLGMASTGYDISASPQERRALGYRWENDACAREPDMAHGAFGAMGGVQTSADDYARWVAFLLSAWPPRDGPSRGRCAASTRARAGPGAELRRASPRRPGERRALPAGRRLWHGLPRRAGLRPRPDPGAWRRLSGLRLLPAAAARARRRHLRLRQPHLCRRRRRRSGRRRWRCTGPACCRRAPSRSATRWRATYRRRAAMYAAGNLEPAARLLAMNFLMDRAAENWARGVRPA